MMRSSIPKTDRWLSVAEAVEVLGRSASGIRGLIRDGKLQAVQHVEGGKYQIRESECERYLAAVEFASSKSLAA